MIPILSADKDGLNAIELPEGKFNINGKVYRINAVIGLRRQRKSNENGLDMENQGRLASN